VRHSIVKALGEALADTARVAAQRPGALERLHLPLEDWRALRARLADAGARMTGLLDVLGLTALVTSIDGVSTLSGAASLCRVL
jgi:transposase